MMSPPPRLIVAGPGMPPGYIVWTAYSETLVVWFPEWNAAGVDARAVRRHRERARSVAEERELGERRAAGAEPRLVASNTQTSARPTPGVVRSCAIAGVLAAVRGRDECAVAARAGEHDVARLVADEQRARDVARARRSSVDDADAVGEVVDDPDLAFVARRDRDRLEADRRPSRRASGFRRSRGRSPDGCQAC